MHLRNSGSYSFCSGITVSGKTLIYIPTEAELREFFNVMEGMDGKKCKFCGTPFSSDEVIYGHRSQMIKIYNSYKMYGKEMVPCYSCGRWRFIDTDFE